MKSVWLLTLLTISTFLSTEAQAGPMSCASAKAGKRCIFGPIPVTGSAMFSEAVVEINVVNPSDKVQHVNIEISGHDGIAFNDNLLSLIQLGFNDGYTCDTPVGLAGALLGFFRHCKIKSNLKDLDPGTSITLPIQVKVDSKKLKSGAMYKIEVDEDDGNVMALILVHKNELQNWVGLGCAVTGCGVGGGVGTVSNTIIYPLNGGKPF